LCAAAAADWLKVGAATRMAKARAVMNVFMGNVSVDCAAAEAGPPMLAVKYIAFAD
jgi:hypothetical protein